MAATRICPNCAQPNDDDSDFCIYCGTRLPVASPTIGNIRRCGNGHEIDDPELNYCPICGLPLDSVLVVTSAKSSILWTCLACGISNPDDKAYCGNCGKPKGFRPTSHASDPIVRSPHVSTNPSDYGYERREIFPPVEVTNAMDGLEAPGDNALIRKKVGKRKPKDDKSVISYTSIAPIVKPSAEEDLITDLSSEESSSENSTAENI